MNKLCLKLISIIFISAVISGCLIQTKADIVFQDNFGSGNLNNWTVVGSPSIVTAPTVAGSTYAVQFPSYSTTILGEPSSNISYIQAPFPQSNTATLEFYFQFDAIVQDIVFADIINGGIGNLWIMLSPYVNNGSLYFMFSYPTSEGSFSRSVLSNVQPDVWYKFDITIAMNDNLGSIQLLINDSPVFSETKVQFGWNPTVFKLGNIISSGNSTANIYIDDVTVTNTANISQPTSTPSPTTSPTAPTSPSSPITNSSPSPSNTSNSSSLDALEFPSLLVLVTLFIAVSVSIRP